MPNPILSSLILPVKDQTTGTVTNVEYDLPAGGSSITVDDEISSTSTNPVQNKVISDALDEKANTEDLGTAASRDVPTSGNANVTQVVIGSDTRLTNARPASDVSDWAKADTKPTYIAAEVGAIPTTEKGANSGVAELDENGKVPSSQLPSYVDDVLEYESVDDLPLLGETGKIYVVLDTNKTYRWSGSAYVVISPSLALGETSSTAYRGDRGKTAYDHSQTTSGNPHNVTKSDVGLGNVGNFKAVSTVASQGLTDTEKSNARANIGAGTSSLALGTSSSTAFRGDYGNSAYAHAVTNKGAAFSSGLYKITTNSEGHVTAATAVEKADITGLGIPGSNTTYSLKEYTATPANIAAFVQATATGTITAHFKFKDTNNVLGFGANVWVRGYMQYQNAYGGSYSVEGRGFVSNNADSNMYLVKIDGTSSFTVTRQVFRKPTGDAVEANVLSGKTFSNGSSDGLTGSMTNRGAVSQTLNTSTTSYTIPAGYHNGSGKVSITTETKTATPSTSSQSITPSSGKVLSKVTVNAISTQEKTVTSSRSAQTVTPDSGKYLSKVTVNALAPTGTYTATTRSNSIDMGATSNYRYVKTSGVPNSNSGTYTPTGDNLNSTAADMGATNSYRYVNTYAAYQAGAFAARVFTLQQLLVIGADANATQKLDILIDTPYFTTLQIGKYEASSDFAYKRDNYVEGTTSSGNTVRLYTVPKTSTEITNISDIDLTNYVTVSIHLEAYGGGQYSALRMITFRGSM